METLHLSLTNEKLGLGLLHTLLYNAFTGKYIPDKLDYLLINL